MGCDCGCGGTCGMCAPRLEREMLDRSWEIKKVAQQVEVARPTPKKEKVAKK